MREWVLAFTAPLGNAHRDHADWRADLQLYPGEEAGYFGWATSLSARANQPGRSSKPTTSPPSLCRPRLALMSARSAPEGSPLPTGYSSGTWRPIRWTSA